MQNTGLDRMIWAKSESLGASDFLVPICHFYKLPSNSLNIIKQPNNHSSDLGDFLPKRFKLRALPRALRHWPRLGPTPPKATRGGCEITVIWGELSKRRTDETIVYYVHVDMFFFIYERNPWNLSLSWSGSTSTNRSWNTSPDL